MAHMLPTVHINGTTYFVDERLHELRSIDDPNRAMRFPSELELRTFLGTIQNFSVLIEDALDAFWKVIADRFPAAYTGDLSPERTIALDMAAERAVGEWIENNAL